MTNSANNILKAAGQVIITGMLSSIYAKELRREISIIHLPTLSPAQAAAVIGLSIEHAFTLQRKKDSTR